MRESLHRAAGEERDALEMEQGVFLMTGGPDISHLSDELTKVGQGRARVHKVQHYNQLTSD